MLRQGTMLHLSGISATTIQLSVSLERMDAALGTAHTRTQHACSMILRVFAQGRNIRLCVACVVGWGCVGRGDCGGWRTNFVPTLLDGRLGPDDRMGPVPISDPHPPT